MDWPYFPIIIILDWSWALIHAVLIKWNNTDIYEYLKVSCKYVIGKNVFPKNLMKIQNCAVHFLHRVSMKFDEIEPDFILDCLAFMIQCQKLEDLYSLFQNMMTVLLAPFETLTTKAWEDLYESKCKRYTELIECNEEKKDGTQNDKEDDDKKEYFLEEIYTKVIYKSSPFYALYSRELNKLKEKLNKYSSESENEKNSYQSEQLAEYIVDHYMPFVTMWSGLLLNESHKNVAHLHNQHIEAHFHQIKKIVLNGKEDQPTGLVVRQFKKYSEALTKTIRFGLKDIRRSRKETEFAQTKDDIIP